MRVLGLVPYFSGTSSATNSALETRRQYLEATIDSMWSFCDEIRVGTVQEEHDVHDLALTQHLVEEDTPPEWLPIQFLRETKAEDLSDIDLIYYTEADQVAHIKDLESILHFPKDIRFLIPHRMEELYEGEGADRGDGFFEDGRKFVIANGAAPPADATFYKPRNVVERFGGAWLASKRLFLGAQFRQSWYLPVEQACFGVAEAGTAWKTVDYRGFWVEHLSGIEFHEKLYRLRSEKNGPVGELEVSEEEEGSGEAVDVQVSDESAPLPDPVPAVSDEQAVNDVSEPVLGA